VSITLVAVLVAGLVSFLFLPPVYEARAAVLITKTRSEIVLEPKYKTLSDEELGSSASQHQALVELAKSSAVASGVIEELGDILEPEERWPDTLLERVEVADRGDYIGISAKSASPQKAAAVANAWGKAYESYINKLYGGTSISQAEIEAQADAARKKYEQAQGALVGFITDNRLNGLERSIAEKSNIISSLQSGKQTAVTAALDKQVEAKIQTMTDYYAVKNKVERLLCDARSLRDQIEQDSSSSSTANSLALLLLQTSAFTTWADLPVDFQIPMEQVSGLNSSPDEQLKDLDSLISTLENKLQDIRVDIEEQSTEILTGAGYTSEKSEALPGLEGLEDIVAYSTSGEPITDAVNKLQGEINRLKGELEQERAREQELERARNLAWETYTTLARKVAEVGMAAEAQDTEVRFAVPAVVPREPVAPRKTMNVAIAAVIGLVVGVLGAFGVEYFGRKPE
jgi:uncharacterized protein involved in exopolysaccharide biosynthesis